MSSRRAAGKLLQTKLRGSAWLVVMRSDMRTARHRGAVGRLEETARPASLDAIHDDDDELMIFTYHRSSEA